MAFSVTLYQPQAVPSIGILLIADEPGEKKHLIDHGPRNNDSNASRTFRCAIPLAI